MGWQPIETAPKDGTSVLLFDRDYGIATAAYFNGWQDSYSNFEDATHWMPLPEPPSAPEQAE
jgi:hypothetical protein